jgi:hypothetical protein
LATWADRLDLNLAALKEQFLQLRGVASGFRKSSSDTLEAWQKAVSETQCTEIRRRTCPIAALLPLLRRFAAYIASTCGVEQYLSKFKRVLGECRGFSPQSEKKEEKHVLSCCLRGQVHPPRTYSWQHMHASSGQSPSGLLVPSNYQIFLQRAHCAARLSGRHQQPVPVGQRLNWLLDLVMERHTREPTPPFARPARCGGSDNTLNSSRGRLLQRNGAWTPSSMGWR